MQELQGWQRLVLRLVSLADKAAATLHALHLVRAAEGGPAASQRAGGASSSGCGSGEGGTAPCGPMSQLDELRQLVAAAGAGDDAPPCPNATFLQYASTVSMVPILPAASSPYNSDAA